MRRELIRSAEESRQNELESLIRSPRRWWSVVRKSGLTDGRKKTSDIGKVCDEVGVMRQVKEAVEVWRRHFERVLNEGGRSVLREMIGERR